MALRRVNRSPLPWPDRALFVALSRPVCLTASRQPRIVTPSPRTSGSDPDRQPPPPRPPMNSTARKTRGDPGGDLGSAAHSSTRESLRHGAGTTLPLTSCCRDALLYECGDSRHAKLNPKTPGAPAATCRLVADRTYPTSLMPPCPYSTRKCQLASSQHIPNVSAHPKGCHSSFPGAVRRATLRGLPSAP